MNAVVYMARQLPPETVRRLAALRVPRFDPDPSKPQGAPRIFDVDQARTRVVTRWGDDLCGLLNALSRGELVGLCRALAVEAPVRSPELRATLWAAGARLERGDAEIAPAVQPRPIVLGGHLVVQAPPRGLFPASAVWPRPLPPVALPAPPSEEPDSLDELLAAADRTIGVRLGRRGRDKGAWGLRAAALLGIAEHNEGEPDWRGDVEVKTVPVAIDRGVTPGAAAGWWRVVEDPAIAMFDPAAAGSPHETGGALAKLQRTLWLARADVGDGDATIVSWYLLEWDPEIARLAGRYLHDRPKGPAGTDARALYLHKRFFADAGFLATLNGLP